MTLEQATARIATLEAEAVTAQALVVTTATEHNNKVTQLNTENAERRVLNNQQKKSLFAAKAVISKNNIKVDYESLGSDGLTLNATTGAVEGNVTYDPTSKPEVGAGSPVTSGVAPIAMTVESIQGMSRADIAKNWDAVAGVLEAQATQPN